MTVSYSFSNGYWIAERALVTVTSATTDGDIRMRVQTKYSLQSAWFTRVDATYKADGNGKVVIDVTDALRAYANASGVYAIRVRIDEVTAGTYDSQQVTTMGLINPAKMVMPDGIDLSAQYSQIIMPPRRMLQPIAMSVSGLVTIAECYFGGNASAFTIPNAEAAFVDEDKRTIQCYNKLQIARSGNVIYDTTLETASNRCRLYAVVEWESATGVIRRHTFWVKKPQTETANSYELLTNDNSFNIIKGREESCSLMIDGLNAYDVWYYSDLAFSSKVRVNIYNGAGIATGWMNASITTKKMGMYDGDSSSYKVEFDCKYKRYDAVTM